MNTLRMILAAFVLAGVNACGQTGPLYLPDKSRPTPPAPSAGQPESSSRQP
ncbi:MAG: LPS translocon maturation chaperone LptM [Oxalobacteraceae bacterium]